MARAAPELSLASSLPVDDRIAREIRNNAVLIEAATGMVEQLEALASPAGTDRFQQALTAFLSDFALPLEATQNNLSLATSHDSVDESYRDFVSTMGPLAQNLRFEAPAPPRHASMAARLERMETSTDGRERCAIPKANWSAHPFGR